MLNFFEVNMLVVLLMIINNRSSCSDRSCASYLFLFNPSYFGWLRSQ